MEFQRFTAPDPVALQVKIAQLRDQLSQALQADDSLRIVDHTADLASLLTTARCERDALALLQAQLHRASVVLAQEPAGWFWNAYGTALQYSGKRSDSNTAFATALDLAHGGGWRRLQAFVLQHWGRSLVEQGELDQARQKFEAALSIRRELNDALAASTEQALAALTLLRHCQPCNVPRQVDTTSLPG